MDALIDAHLHFWDLKRTTYATIPPDAPIYRSWLPIDIIDEMHAHGVAGVVAVQSADTVEETSLMLGMAKENDFILGVVGWIDLEHPELAQQMLQTLSGDRHLCGIRHLIHGEADPDWVLRPPVLESLRMLAAAGLPFDLVAVLPRHLEAAAVLADRLPDLIVIIDHLGKPDIRNGEWFPWAALLREAASRPNIAAKVSGLNTAAAPGWHRKHLRPYVEHALDVFGPARLMFGGDWPVCLLQDTYGRVVDETASLIDDLLSGTERRQVRSGTAVRLYGLAA